VVVASFTTHLAFGSAEDLRQLITVGDVLRTGDPDAAEAAHPVLATIRQEVAL